MLEKVCYFNYNIFIPDFDSPIRGASIVAFEYTRNERDQLFKECFKMKIPYLKDFHPKRVYLDTVENYITGLKCLIVVILSENKIATFMYCKTLRNGLFYMQILPLPSHQTKRNINLFVTDGPMVILFSDNEMTFHSICQKTKNSLDLTSYCKNNQFQILQCSGIGQLLEINSESILLVSLTYINDHNKNNIEILVVAVNTQNSYTPVIHHSVPQQYFFPKAFISSVQSLWITNLSTANCYTRLQSKESPKKISSSLNNLFKSNHSYVCTSENFLVFHNAELVHVCDLPHLNMYWDIRVDLWESSDSPFSALLVNKDQDVYLIKKSPFSDKLQVTKSWEGIDCILTGTVKANDTKKLLMLRDCSFLSWQEEIFFCDILCDVTMDLMNQSDIPSAAIEKTIPGIKSNVEAGKSAVAEAEWEISQKIGATLDALYKIKNEVPKENAVAQQILSFQETLLDILINPNGKCEKKDPMEHNELIYFKKHQIHIVGHRVILCLEFSNIDKRPFCHPSIKIFVENQSLNCVQKVFVRRKGIELLDEDEDEIRQIIHPNEEFYVLVSLKIPQFVSEIKFEGILSGSFGFSQDNLLPLQAEAFYHLQKHLGISIWPSLWEELKDISLRNELKYFRIIQHRTVFSVSSLKSKLSGIETSLKPPLGNESEPPLLLSNMRPDTSKTTQVFANASSEVYGVSMAFQGSKKYGLEIEAFTRSDKEAFLLVKMMYCNLESDFLILPIGLSSSEHEELKQKAVRAMKEEVDFLLSAIDINSGIQSSNEQEKNRITRKQFLKMRSFATRKEAITDNIMQDLYSIYSLITNV